MTRENRASKKTPLVPSETSVPPDTEGHLREGTFLSPKLQRTQCDLPILGRDQQRAHEVSFLRPVYGENGLR